MFDLDHYLALVPSFNQNKPKFTAMLAAVLQPLVDSQTLLANLPTYFDIDVAVGVQLDVVGQWLGRSRWIPVPNLEMWFSFGDPMRGFGQGYWHQPLSPGLGLVALDDDNYRRLLKTIVVLDAWDGSAFGLQVALDTYFDNPQTLAFVQDNGDMSISIGIAQKVPSALDIVLLGNRIIPAKPEAIKTSYYVTTVDRTPLFGFGMNNDYVAGFGMGAWGATPDAIQQQTVRVLPAP